jgi:hypothetical protein
MMMRNYCCGRNNIVAIFAVVGMAGLRNVDGGSVPAFLGSSSSSSSSRIGHHPRQQLQREKYYQQEKQRSRARAVATQRNRITSSHPLRTTQDDTDTDDDSDDSDDTDKSPKPATTTTTTTRLGEPISPEKRLYTYEELQSNPELWEMEAQQAKQRHNLWSLPGRVGQAMTAVGWLFVIITTILNTQGYAWIPSANGEISLGTLEERNFVSTMYGKKKAAATTKSPLLLEQPEKSSSTAASVLLEQSKSSLPP